MKYPPITLNKFKRFYCTKLFAKKRRISHQAPPIESTYYSTTVLLQHEIRKKLLCHLNKHSKWSTEIVKIFANIILIRQLGKIKNRSNLFVVIESLEIIKRRYAGIIMILEHHHHPGIQICTEAQIVEGNYFLSCIMICSAKLPKRLCGQPLELQQVSLVAIIIINHLGHPPPLPSSVGVDGYNRV